VIISKEINILIINPLLHIVVEEFVCRKLAIQLYLNITNIDIVIITNLNHFLESKAENHLIDYKIQRCKKIFYFAHPRQARAIQGGT